MASMTYRELRRLLVDHGCRYLREARGGGHEIWLCPGRKPISVPKALKGEGTLQKILRDAGIKHA
jgi:predicted RNA binding protein YcfA (HicA-like mRNA interferase family)